MHRFVSSLHRLNHSTTYTFGVDGLHGAHADDEAFTSEKTGDAYVRSDVVQDSTSAVCYVNRHCQVLV